MVSQRLVGSCRATKSRSPRCYPRVSGNGGKRKPVKQVCFTGHSAADADRAYLQERIAVNINVVANVLLLIAKAIATIFSTSLSLLASLADSALDLLSEFFSPLS